MLDAISFVAVFFLLTMAVVVTANFIFNGITPGSITLARVRALRARR
jgi:hypothetical protein